MSKDGLYGPRNDVPLIAVALASTAVFLDMLKAHRSSTWTEMSIEYWAGTALAAITYAILIALMVYAIRFAAERVLPSRWVLGKPMLVEPVIVAAGLFAVIVLMGGGIRPAGLVIAVVFAAIIAGARIWRWVRGGAGLRRFSIGWTFAIAGAIAGLTIANDRLYNAEDRALWTTVAAFMALILVMELWGLIVGAAYALRNREGGWPVAAGIGVVTVTAALLAGLLDLNARADRSQVDRPNLILITADTLRADVMSLHGGDVPTPNLTAIGEQGAIFDAAYSLAPWTLPSMTGMFASRYPHGLNPHGNVDTWSDEQLLYRMEGESKTLAERLRQEGYATAGFVANPLLRDRRGILRGFDTTAFVSHRAYTKESIFSAQTWLENTLHQFGAPWIVERPADATRALVKHGATFIRDQGNRPYFLWLHIMDPHTPYSPPAEYAPDDGPWPVYCNSDPYWNTPLSDDDGSLDVSEDQKRHIQALYEGEVRYVDAAVGRVAKIADIETSNTYFVFTSDHGEEFWEHGGYGHGHSLFDELVQVPFIVTGPDIPPRRDPTPMSAVDLMPTLADFMEVDHDSHWRGVSVATALRAGVEPERVSPVFAQGTNFYCRPEPLQMLVRGNWKAVRGARSGEITLYNIAADPDEKHSLPPSNENAPDTLAAELRALVRSVQEPVGEVYDRKFHDDDLHAIEEQMRGLGYIH